jgi:hypothetical protein
MQLLNRNFQKGSLIYGNRSAAMENKTTKAGCVPARGKITFAHGFFTPKPGLFSWVQAPEWACRRF